MCKVNSTLYESSSSRRTPGQTHWIPNTDVYILDGSLYVNVELAGMRREDLEIAVEGNQLLIKGQRPDPRRAAGCNWLVMEINYGAFECVLQIPQGFNLKQAQAAYTNGFLQILIPRTMPVSSKKLKVPLTETK